MVGRSAFVALVLSLVIASYVALAQQPNRIPIVGVLTTTAGPDEPLFEVFRQSLRDLGYLEGRSIKIEYRTALGHLDRLPDLADELVQIKADVIVVPNPVAVQALRRATSTIPIVIVLFDPVASGLVTNLARPGGNITGLSSQSVDLYSKRLQLLKEMVPGLTRVAVLWNTSALPVALQEKAVEEIKAAARSLSIELRFVVAQTAEEFHQAFSVVRLAQARALYVHESALFYVHRKALANLAASAGLPTIYGSRTFVDEGGLMSYGVDYADEMRRSAGYVDRILKGARAGDLPIEQPTKFELVVNSKAAKALQLTIPASIVLSADEVIR